MEWTAIIGGTIAGVVSNWATEQVKAANAARAAAKADDVTAKKDADAVQRAATQKLEADRDLWREKFFEIQEKHIAAEQERIEKARTEKEK